MSDEAIDHDSHVGQRIYGYIRDLFPLCRSLTGDNNRKTLEYLKQILRGLKIHEVPSGTHVFDWTVPPEWNVTEAWLEGPDGERVLDFEDNNLHLVSYSTPVDVRLPLTDLQPHLHSLEDQPDVIPYRTSYYDRNWGFCLTEKQRVEMADGEYHAVIRSSLDETGSLTYGEWYKRGETDGEFLLSCYICHPSMANDSLSGVALVTELGNWLNTRKTQYSYRIVFVPETIGAIAWLSQQPATRLDKIRFGLVATCCGDDGPFTYKKSRQGKADIDRICQHILTRMETETIVEDFFPLGSDERQYSSPGFNLPVGSLMRSRYHTFPEYHTSADDLQFVNSMSLQQTFDAYCSVIKIAEANTYFKSKSPYCEPQLGKRGLYQNVGGENRRSDLMRATMWLLSLGDGRSDLIDACSNADLDFGTVLEAYRQLCSHNLLCRWPLSGE